MAEFLAAAKAAKAGDCIFIEFRFEGLGLRLQDLGPWGIPYYRRLGVRREHCW